MSDALNEWLNQVKSLELTPAEQAKITNEGAKAFKSELEAVTREKHYSNHHDKVYGHMADSIQIKNTDVDGEKNGSSTVGFDNYHAQNARRLNDGTKKYKADHFVTNVQNSDEVLEKVMNAEMQKYKEIKLRGDS